MGGHSCGAESGEKDGLKLHLFLLLTLGGSFAEGVGRQKGKLKRNSVKHSLVCNCKLCREDQNIKWPPRREGIS